MLFILLDILRDWLYEVGLYWPFGVLDQIEFRALAATLLSFAFVIVFGRRTIRVLVSLKIGDTGLTDSEALRAISAGRRNTPTMGGVLIAGAIVLSAVLLADIRTAYVQMGILTVVWLAALGGADDYLKLTAATRGAGSRQGLYAWEKLVFQLGLGVLLGVFAFRYGDSEAPRDVAHALNIPFQKTYTNAQGEANPSLIYLTGVWYILFMTLITAGLSNAVNITDGMDGLASGCTTAVALGLLVLAVIAGTERWSVPLLVPHVPTADELGVLAGALAGACLGFLWWNCAPAAVFMGDTGSLPIGGLIGYIAVVIRQEFAVLLMCGVFLAEIGSVVLQVGYFKSTGGKRVFRCAPYHHHLHLGGWQEQQVVARMWIVSILLVAFALATVKLR
ncbi:MAG: phospho-N-acetylmuramoyl-pentapeptide-transferase [Planctomycetota bacterium]